MEETLITIDHPDNIESIIDYLKDFTYVALDCETTGLQKNAKVIGFSVSAEESTGIYLVLSYWDKANQKLVDIPGMKEACRPLLECLKDKKLVTHNGMVDFNWLNHEFGTQLLSSSHTDTMILAHVIDENRMSYGLKELSYEEYGADAKKEQIEMKASVIANGGIWEDKRGGNKEMFKASVELMSKYGAKDTILTLRLFYTFVPRLYEQNLDKFFYEEESMPLFKTATYEMNTVGLKVDMPRLNALQVELERECARLKEEIQRDIYPYVREAYPGTSAKNTFNIGAPQQLSWLMFIRLGNDWKKVTKKGRERAKELVEKVPYSPNARKAFMKAVVEAGEKPQKYIQCDKKALTALARKYSWVVKLLEYRKAATLLNTYALGIQEKAQYGIINPSFRQHGTTSGRYASRNPNFQNLPRDDKRIKACIVARTGKVFVGADYSQLEPRTFTAMSQDPILLSGFKNKEDFYSVVGIPVFNKFECSADKKAPNYLGEKFPHIRQAAKAIALGLAYGESAYKLSDELLDEGGHNYPVEMCHKIKDDYFEKYSGVNNFVNESHLKIVNDGVVYSLFGRPRRIPHAKKIKDYGFPQFNTASDLPYQLRTLLNLSVNHAVQSTAASIVNRAAIAFCYKIQELQIPETYMVLQCHDELIAECPKEYGEQVAAIMKESMERTTFLPGVDLLAEPKIGRTLADLK